MSLSIRNLQTCLKLVEDRIEHYKSEHQDQVRRLEQGHVGLDCTWLVIQNLYQLKGSLENELDATGQYDITCMEAYERWKVLYSNKKEV